MRIPKFWSKGIAGGMAERGHSMQFSCWRCSDISPEDAHESAMAAAKRILDALLANRPLERYPYGCQPLREEVTNKLDDEQGNTFAAVTRNSIGSLVLNTERVMFVDIDFPLVFVGEAIRHFLAKLFGFAKSTPEAKREFQAKESIDQFMARHPGWGMRLYRTFAGFRGIVTHDLFDPKSDETFNILRELGSDPLYTRLCQSQECFRARLTPKPWRCGYHKNTIRYPVEDEALAKQFQEWKSKYEDCHKNYATCRFVGQLGNAAINPEVQEVVELHDFVTRCSESLRLA
jgi:hypothetical protein